MTSSRSVLDLMVLVADKNIEFTIKGLLSRPQALGTREVSSRVVRHPEVIGSSSSLWRPRRLSSPRSTPGSEAWPWN